MKRLMERLHRLGIKKGKVVEFYKPAPKPAQPVPELPEEEPICRAGDVLRELLGQEETLHEVLVLLRDNNGQTAIVGNIEGPGETLLMMEFVKHNIMRQMWNENNEPPRRGGA